MPHIRTKPDTIDSKMNQQPGPEASSGNHQTSHDVLLIHLESVLTAARPRLLRFAHMQGVSTDAADDVVQDTLLEAWRHLNRLHTLQGIDAWLNTICHHVCLRWLRTQGMTTARQTSLSTPYQEHDGAESLLEMDIPDPLAFDPAEELSRQDRASLLDRAMGHLPKSTREAIELCYLAELPQQEAALRLGLTINALEVRLHRARRQLRQVLSGELRADAEAFGLVLNQEIAQGWRETRQWCNLCGQHRLRGLFESQPDGRVHLRLRCPVCSPRYCDMFACRLVSLAGFHSFRSAYKHAWKAAAAYWAQTVEQGRQRCTSCEKQLVQLQIINPDEQTLSIPFPGNYRMILDCPTCGITGTCSVVAFLDHPGVLHFMEQHPRWMIGPESAVEHAGQSAICSRLIDTTSATQLTVVVHPQTLQPLAILQE